MPESKKRDGGLLYTEDLDIFRSFLSYSQQCGPAHLALLSLTELSRLLYLVAVTWNIAASHRSVFLSIGLPEKL